MADFNIKKYYGDLSSLFKTSSPVKQRVSNKIAAPGQVGVPVGTARAFLRHVNNAYQSAVASFGTYNRLARYSDYCEMESMAEISSGLDIYADECTTHDENGDILSIISPNPEIRKLLTLLFYDNLNVEFNLWSWVRSLCKYGDQFLLVDHHPDYGVLDLLPMPVNEVEREEGFNPENPLEYRYRWVTQGNRTIEPWEVIHFRVMGNESFLPYGSSILEAARRVWRQLILMEDAVMVYRIVRSPERRVFYIDVGNVAPQDVEKYMERVKTQLKRNMVVSSDTGRVDLRYNPLPIHYATPIPLLDGRTITIKELAQEYDDGKENWVYSIQDDSKKIVPGKVVWCGKNYSAKKITKVTLDDGTHLLTAPEHPFVLRDGSSKRADELCVNDALMPLYRNEVKLTKTSESLYTKVYDPCSNKYLLMHRVVANNVLQEKLHEAKKTVGCDDNKYLVIHHKNFNSLNNYPSNLQWVGNAEHMRFHKDLGKKVFTSYNKTEEKRLKTIEDNKKYKKAQHMNEVYNGTDLHKEHNKIRRKAQLQSWEKNREMRCRTMCWVIPDECIELGKKLWIGNSKLHRDVFIELFKKDPTIRELLKQANEKFGRSIDKLSRTAIERRLNELGYSGFREYRTDSLKISEYKNHKVSKVEEIICEGTDVYCMAVVGPDGEDDRHNFAACSFGNTDMKCSKSAILLRNSVDEDFYIPQRGAESNSRIETLPGGQFTGDIEDLSYIQSFRGNVLVKLLDNTKDTIKNIVNRINSGESLWTYSINPETLHISPSKIIAGQNVGKKNNFIRINLDNEKHIEVTDEHLMILSDGRYIHAKDLKPGDSLSALYTKVSSKMNRNYLDGYEMLYQPDKNRWDYTHRIVAKECLKKDLSKSNVVHHTSFNKLNNSPDFLKVFENSKLHRDFHASVNKDNKIYVGNGNPNFNSEANIETLLGAARLSKNFSELVKRTGYTHFIIRRLVNDLGMNYTEFHKKYMQYNPSVYYYCGYNLTLDDIKEVIRFPEIKSEVDVCKFLSCSVMTLKPILKNSNYRDFRQLYDEVKGLTFQNMVNVASNCSTLKEISLILGCSEGKLKNLLHLNGFKTVKDFRKKFGMRKYSTPQMFKKGMVPHNKVALNHKVVSVEYLNIQEDAYDIQVEKNNNFSVDCGIFVHNSKLFAALKIPKSYLGYEGEIGSKATLSQEDIRFSRTIQRLQRVIVSELNKIAVIHLYSKGFKNSDLVNFDIQLANPSTIAEMQRLELWRTKFEVAGVVQEGMFDKNFVYRRIWKLSDSEIEQIEEGRKKDKMFDMELENITVEPAEEAAPLETPPEEPTPAGGIEEPAAAAPPTEPGLPPPPGEAEPLTAGKDPNAQIAAPNELIKPFGIKRKKKSTFPNLKNYVFNTKKTALDHHRNYSELNRFAKNPFGECVESVEDKIFNKNLNKIEELVNKLESLDKFNKTKKVMSD